VLLLEAGGRDDWIWYHIPVGYLFAIGNPRADRMFETEPEKGLNGRSLNYPRGKVIGGSSAINAMILRGQAADYDHWRQLGLAGWGWDDVLPYFKRHERTKAHVHRQRANTYGTASTGRYCFCSRINSAALAQWRTTPRQLGRAAAKADQSCSFRV
jgi:choline dehydrogenase-like flavoprotein